MKTEDQGPLEGEPESRIARAARKAMREMSGKSPESQIAESARKAMERHIIDERARNKAQMRIDSGRAITEGGDPLSSKPLVPSDSSASGERPEAVIPEGWALVPREPTWQMWDQAENASMQCDWQTEAGVESKHGAYEFPTGRIWALVCGYRAMVEAAPPPPTASGLSATARSNEQRAIEELGGGGVPEPLTDEQIIELFTRYSDRKRTHERHGATLLEFRLFPLINAVRALGAVAPEKSPEMPEPL